MAVLRDTQEVLHELSADRQRQFGGHVFERPRNNGLGINLGQVPFEADKHQFSDISEFSLEEEATGLPHVPVLLPKRALNIGIIEDARLSNDDPRIAVIKRRLVSTLRDSLEESKPGMTDRVTNYLIADPDSKGARFMDLGTEFIDASEGDEAVSFNVAQMCTRGLTFIVSDFKRLRFNDIPGHYFESTVAVKANHPAEIYIPASSPKKPIVLTIAPGKELDTSNPMELEEFNQSRALQNGQIEAGIRGTGMALARVVFKPNLLEGFNPEEADVAICEAVREIVNR